MNLKPTRRQMLMAATCSVMATQVSATAISSYLTTARQLASWDDGALLCWFEGQAADVPRVVADAQAVWGERAIFQHFDSGDLTNVLGLIQQNCLPTMQVGCHTSQDLPTAFNVACRNAMAHRSKKHTGTVEGALVLVNIPTEDFRMADLAIVGQWAKMHIADGALWACQVLEDESLAVGSQRISVVIARDARDRRRSAQPLQTAPAVGSPLTRNGPPLWFLKRKSL